jgi:phage shock protein A
MPVTEPQQVIPATCKTPDDDVLLHELLDDSAAMLSEIDDLKRRIPQQKETNAKLREDIASLHAAIGAAADSKRRAKSQSAAEWFHSMDQMKFFD